MSGLEAIRVPPPKFLQMFTLPPQRYFVYECIHVMFLRNKPHSLNSEFLARNDPSILDFEEEGMSITLYQSLCVVNHLMYMYMYINNGGGKVEGWVDFYTCLMGNT